MRRVAGLVAACVIGWSQTGAAQVPYTVSLRIDNDAFDFWLPPWNRPDGEYTSGVHVSGDGGDAPWWARGFLHSPPCAMRIQECKTGRIEIGQDLYSPDLTLDKPLPPAGARQNAGWLYVSQSAQLLRADQSDALAITLGVTGPPSLGRQTQHIAHDLAPAFNRPTDWDRQIPFEPGVILRYEHRERLAVLDFGSGSFDIVPRAAASVGNVTTDAELGLQARVGWHLRHPWLPTDGPTEIALVAGVSGRAIARDLFLDGRDIRDSVRITHLPFVGSSEAGLEFRHRWLTLSYRAVNDGRSYAAGPRTHAWASIVGGVTFAR